MMSDCGPRGLWLDRAVSCARGGVEAYCDAADEERPVALSWHMISRDRERLRNSPRTEKRNCPTRAALVEWWTSAPPRMLWGCDRPMSEPPPMAEAP